ncbi:hypothetical protein J6590_097690, partial [Homalodisca vitripennis]
AMRFEEPQYLYERLLYRDDVSHCSTLNDKPLHFRRVRSDVGRRVSQTMDYLDN